MSTHDRIADVVSALAPVRDDELTGAARSPQGAALLGAIVASPVYVAPAVRRRSRLLVVMTAFAVVVVVTTAALGVVGHVKSWISGWHDPDVPVPTRPDVVLASGVDGVPWKLIATPTDQGLCLFLVRRAHETVGSGGCGYLDIRGDFPPDLRGDPSEKCIATPTTLAPCGSLPKHWLDISGTGSSSHIPRDIVFGPIAGEVALVELGLTNGEAIRPQIVDTSARFGAPLKVYWATVPHGTSVRMAVARDAAGQILERRVQAWNGNPTGDPDGPKPPHSP